MPKIFPPPLLSGGEFLAGEKSEALFRFYEISLIGAQGRPDDPNAPRCQKISYRDLMPRSWVHPVCQRSCYTVSYSSVCKFHDRIYVTELGARFTHLLPYIHVLTLYSTLKSRRSWNAFDLTFLHCWQRGVPKAFNITEVASCKWGYIADFAKTSKVCFILYLYTKSTH